MKSGIFDLIYLLEKEGLKASRGKMKSMSKKSDSFFVFVFWIAAISFCAFFWIFIWRLVF